MTEQPYPPPPPEPLMAEVPQKTGFHGPETNLFKGIRTQLALLEQNLHSSFNTSHRNGLLVAMILSGSMGIGLSLLLEFALSGVGTAGFVSIFPLIEEVFKGLSVFLVVWLMWKSIPSRRYGALIGAASGLGFAIVENIIFNVQTVGANATGGQIAEAIIVRWIGLPFMHVLWSAFIGVGLFVLLAQRKVPGTRSWLAAPMLLFGWVAHMCWNGVAIGMQAAGIDIIAVTLLDIIIVFLPFSLFLRDFLGGHFNLRDFLMGAQEQSLPPSPTFAPPAPPPPP
jgi:RsiW-degrading membrane proteinase PrsW (M82 family)